MLKPNTEITLTIEYKVYKRVIMEFILDELFVLNDDTPGAIPGTIANFSITIIKEI